MGFKLRNRKLAKSDEDAYDAATLSWRVAAAHAVAEGILHDVYAGCIDRLQALLLQRQIMLNRAQFEDLCHRSQYFLVLTNSVSASKTLCVFRKESSWKDVYVAARGALQIHNASSLLLWWDESWLPSGSYCLLPAISDSTFPSRYCSRSVFFYVKPRPLESVEVVDATYKSESTGLGYSP